MPMKIASVLLVVVAALVCADARAQVIYEAPDPDVRWDGTDYTVELDDPFAFYNEDARRSDKEPRLVGYPITVVRDPRPYAGGVSYRRPELFQIARNLDRPEVASFNMKDLNARRMGLVNAPVAQPKAPEMVWIGPDIKPQPLNLPVLARGEIVIKPWKAGKTAAPIGVAKSE